MNKSLWIGILFVFLMLVNTANAVTVTPKPQSDWKCVDYSLDFAKHNPNWGIVTISNNECFYGVSHMVNYQVIDHDTLKIHDGLYGADYDLAGWRCNGYYHFWLKGEQPCRTYRFLYDNSEVIQ